MTLFASSGAHGPGVADFSQGIIAFNQFAEGRILPIQESRVGQADKELTARRIGILRARHGKHAADVRESAFARMDERSREMYAEIEAGTFDAQAFADRHGITIGDVRAARARMKYHVKEVIEASDEGQSSYGREVRACRSDIA